MEARGCKGRQEKGFGESNMCPDASGGQHPQPVGPEYIPSRSELLLHGIKSRPPGLGPETTDTSPMSGRGRGKRGAEEGSQPRCGGKLIIRKWKADSA